jgi:hypothetical protein
MIAALRVPDPPRIIRRHDIISFSRGRGVRMKKATPLAWVVRLAASCLLLLALPSPVLPQAERPPAQPPPAGAEIKVETGPLDEEGPLVPTGEPPDIALIYTGGVVGYVEPCG